MKRIGVGISILVVVAGMVGSGGGDAVALDVSGSFTDDDGSVFEFDIEAIYAAGITKGCGTRLFCPTAPVTRAQMASLLARALGLEPLPSGPFTDLGTSVHAGDINAIAAAGITVGCDTGLYCPSGLVRRDEMASFLTRGFALAPGEATFTDIAGNPHAGSIGAIQAAGITTGCSPTTYCPASHVTRGEMAAFLRRAMKLALVYPRLSLSEGLPLTCTKDGLACRATIAISSRPAYRISEGLYNVLPYRPGEQQAFEAAGTRVAVSINGAPVGMVGSTVTQSGGRAYRRFESTVGFSKGTHTVVAQWWWNGNLTHTNTITIIVG